uniref:Peroxiredoxin like 2C n=1 Tax=Neolamprologus brichardi TaxID=32507 RepID=A0A3Q4HNR3_NEOBR
MAEVVSPITRQVTKGSQENVTCFVDINLRDVEDCLIYDQHGVSIPFKTLYQDRKSVIIFVRNFLCYSCKEYVDDLGKIPREVLEDAEIRLVVIGQSAYHHIKVIIFKYLISQPHGSNSVHLSQPSPHVKSGVFMGQIKTIWRAVTSPAFDFQGDLHQQGGAIIAGPGSKVHFSHLDMNRLDHMPINWLLQLAGAQQTIDFSDKPKIIHI